MKGKMQLFWDDHNRAMDALAATFQFGQRDSQGPEDRDEFVMLKMQNMVTTMISNQERETTRRALEAQLDAQTSRIAALHITSSIEPDEAVPKGLKG